MTEDALESAWADVGSGDRERIDHALDSFRALIPRAVMTEGEGGDAHRSALRGLAFGLDELDRPDEAREMYRALADVCDAAMADPELPEEQRARLLDDRLYARAAALIVGQDPQEVSPAQLAGLDALIAEGERLLGGAHGRVLWLLERRAAWLTRRDPEEGLQAYDLLIARAAADQEGGANHLMTLAAKARELSRLDEDDQSALLWGQVLDGRRALLGLDDPATLDAWWWRARTRFWAMDPAGSEADLALLVPALQRLRGEDDPLTLEAMRFRIGVLRALRRGDAGGGVEDPLPLLGRIAMLEAARFGPGSPEVLNTRMMAIETALDRAGPDTMLGLVDEATHVAEDAAELGALSRTALRARSLEARVRQEAMSVIPDPGLHEVSQQRAADRCDALARALAAQPRRSLTEREHGDALPHDEAAEEELYGEIRRAWLDRAFWAGRLSMQAIDLLRSGARLLSGYAGEARRHEIALRDELGERLREAGRGEEALAEYLRSLDLETALAGEVTEPSERVVAATRLAQSRQAVGVTLRGLGRTEDSEAVLRRAIANAENDGAAKGAIDDLRDSWALALQELGRADEAAAEMRALFQASGDVHHAIDLAAVHLNNDRPAEVEVLLRPILAQLEAEGQGESVPALRVLGNLALAACQLDRDAEAAAAYDRLYALQVRLLGPDHRDTLITLHNRALEERHLGRPAESVRRFEHVLERRSAALGARDPHTLSTLSALAGAVQDTGDLHRARALAEQAVALSRDVLGPTHPQTLRRIRDLDGILAALDGTQRERDALTNATREGFASMPVGAGEDSPGLVSLRYAEHLARQQRFGDALVEYSRARDALADQAGVDWLQAERGVAECAQRLGAHPEAADAYARIVPQLERLLPSDRWAIAEALNERSLALSHLGRIDEMIAAQERAVAVADEAGPPAERAVQLRQWLGRRLASAGRQAQALEHYTLAVEAGTARLGPEHPVTLDARDDQAEALLALGRPREALKIYRTNIPAMQRVLGPGSSALARALAARRSAAADASRPRRLLLGALIIAAVVVYVVWFRFG